MPDMTADSPLVFLVKHLSVVTKCLAGLYFQSVLYWSKTFTVMRGYAKFLKSILIAFCSIACICLPPIIRIGVSKVAHHLITGYFC